MKEVKDYNIKKNKNYIIFNSKYKDFVTDFDFYLYNKNYVLSIKPIRIIYII